MSGIPVIEPYPLPGPGDLPPNIATWTVDPGRAVLLVHDMQRFFLRPLPQLLREALIANAARLREACAQSGMPIAYTAQPGGMTRQERGLLADFWGPGMTTAPADRHVVPALAPALEDWTLTKWRYSAFHRSGLLDAMRANGRDQLLICGVYGHVGVLASAVESFSHDIQTFLAADAIADFSHADHRMTIEYAARRCAVVESTERLIGMAAKEVAP